MDHEFFFTLLVCGAHAFEFLNIAFKIWVELFIESRHLSIDVQFSGLIKKKKMSNRFFLNLKLLYVTSPLTTHLIKDSNHLLLS